MYSQSSIHDSQKTSGAPKGLTALLLGIIVCYQVVNHMVLHQAVSEADEFDSDGSCSAVPGVPGHSSLCMEAKLFQGWQQELPAESPAELEQLLVVSPSKSPVQEEQPSATTKSPAAPAQQAQAQAGSAATTVEKEQAIEEVKPEALEGLLWDLAWKMGGGDKSHSAPDKNKKKKPIPKKPKGFMAKEPEHKPHKTDFAENLSELQQKLEAKMNSQARRHAEHRKLRALSHAAHGHTHDTSDTHHMSAWARDLDHLTHDLQDHMRDWRKERAAHAAIFAAATKKSPPEEDTMTPWAHKVDDMTHDIEEHMKAREKERAEHAAAHEAMHAARMKALSEKADHHSPFMDEIDALGWELCQDPSRHDRPACAQFLHPHHNDASSDVHATEKHHEHHEKAHENAMAHIKLLEKHLEELEKDRLHDNEEIKKESNQFLKELCADPARHSYPACARILKGADSATKKGSTNLRSPQASAASSPDAASSTSAHSPIVPHGPLHWTAMSKAEGAENSHTHHMGASPLLMHRQELRGAHWEGKIPKVACVSVLPQGQTTETLMKYFLDNYNLQHYEGQRTLVLVFHSDDKEAARVAHSHADGTNIIAAAARGGSEFPSATAYRYGAWLAHDSDIVVRWDFEAWHHPNRLSMQVRSMVLSKRPASVVARVTAFDAEGKNGTVAGGVGPHGSVMGDAAWMRRHWMPVLEEESALLHGLHSSDVVQVAMPELLAYHDVSMLGSAVHSWVDIDS